MDVKHGQMPGADKLHRTVASCAAHDESGKLSRESALAENTIGILNHAIERETGFSESTKCCVQMAHQHGRGNAFAGNIAQQEQQSIAGLKKIAIVAAHHVGGLIVVADFPSSGRQVRFRQEHALDICGQRKIALQRALFGGRKMVEAKTHQRISQQAFRFNAAVAGLADSEGTLVKTAQRTVYRYQQFGKRGIGGRRMQRLMKSLAAYFQLGSQIHLFGSSHTTSGYSLRCCS